jgi:PilZ domain
MTEEQDGRIAKRLRVLKSAKIIFNRNQSIVDCAIRDLSATGAKVICTAPVHIPDIVRILFTQDNTIRDAKVMWRKDEFLGLHFTSDATRAPPRKF